VKIAIIGPGLMSIPPTSWGAVEILIWDYYQNLINLGHQVKILLLLYLIIKLKIWNM